jgi:hypothetical protein
MPKCSSIYKLLALMVPFTLLLLVLLTSCETTKEKIVQTVVHDTVTVRDTIMVSIISVDQVYADPDSIAQGGKITLSAKVSILPGAQVGTLTYNWFATAGTFDKTTGDTVVWKAPDEPAAYEISVHVTDGTYIGLGKQLVGVGMYAPYQTPYYLGAATCSGCHGDTYTSWAQTGHAHAWATLQSSGQVASYCIPCHTVGFEGPLGNSGFDEAPITKFENVQCENCHGAASTHLTGTLPKIDWSAQNCGKCHEGTHHPYYSEWQQSKHNTIAEADRGTCQGCHEGVAAGYRLSGDLSTFYNGGAVSSRPDTSEVPIQPKGCTTCHNPHDATNPGQLRTVADVHLVTANGESPVITDGGVGKLCMQCHHARYAAESQLTDGNAHFGPHDNPQTDMLAARSGYQGVASSEFIWAQPKHLYVQNSCKTCHLNQIEYISEEQPTETGHTFEPTVEACANCHGIITSFKDIKAMQDYDGDGQIEGVQDEVQGLMDRLEAALISTGLDTTGGVSLAEALGDTSKSTYIQREAGYNLIFVESDGSHGVHNPEYAVQLLQQSYQYLMDKKVPGAAILNTPERAVVMR